MPLSPEPTLGWHVAELSKRLRTADKNEVEAACGLGPLEGLVYSVASSHLSYTVMEGDEPVAIYGGTRVGGGKGIIWMLASDALERHSIQFLRESRSHIDALQIELQCPEVFNFTDKRNTLHHKWLRWTGFTFEPEIPYGHLQLPFYKITRVMPNV